MFTTKGLVLSRKKVAEGDVIINILTFAKGKIRVYVNGARYPKSRFASATQPFTEGEFSLFTSSRDLARLSEVQVTNAHLDIRDDMNKIFLATYMLELVDLAIEDGDFIPGLYDKVTYALSQLENAADMLRFKVVYDLKLIAALGYRPTLNSCSVCGSKKQLMAVLSVEHGGVVCRDCLAEVARRYRFEPTDLNWINFVLKKPFKTIQTIAVSDTMLLKLSTWTNNFLETHVVRRPLKSYKMLKLL